MSVVEGVTALNPSVADIQKLPAQFRVTVPAEYIDRLGHMNVEWYFKSFGKAAMATMHAIGNTEEYIDVRRGGSFVGTQVIRYLAEVREGDTIAVHGRILGRSEKKLHHMYFMVNETQQKLAATLEALNIHADLEQRRSSPFPQDIASNIDLLLAKHRNVGWDAPASGLLSA